MIAVAFALCWLAALHRVYLAVRSPRLWRVAFAIAVTALAVTVTATSYGSWLDELTPHLDTLVARCAAAVSAWAGTVYIRTLQYDRPPRRVLVRAAIGGVLAIALLAGTWALAPLHRGGDLFGEIGTDPFIDVHNVVYYLYVAHGAGVAAAYSARRLFPRRTDDAARAPSLALIGLGTALASGALLLGAGSIVAPDPVSGGLQSVKDVLVPVAAAVLATGVLLLLAVSPAITEVVELQRRWLRLRSLWTGLTGKHPDVTLHVPPSWPPREALRIREQRALVEIHDALAREKVPAGVTTIEALARTLRQGQHGPVPATSVLPASGDFRADLATVLQLAAAYDSARR